MSTPIFHVDAFTNEPFAGNPACVCLMKKARDERWMQQVAAEMNQAETAFVLREGDGFRLRWFTPTTEVDLCGHATLAAAHVLWETKKVAQKESIGFETKSGVLTCARRGEWIEMNFPATPAEVLSQTPPDLLDALGISAATVARSKFDVLVELSSEKLLRGMIPDIARLKRVPCRGVIVTAKAGETFDFVARFFAPQSGIDEDQVTGSAYCCLGPWWGKKLGKTELRAFQASQRGGEVGMRLNGDRVLLGGRAVTVLEGDLRA